MFRLVWPVVMMLLGASGAWAQTPAARNTFVDAASAADAAMHAHHFDPASLDTPAYAAMEAQAAGIAAHATTRAGFVEAFNAAWRDGPFSHVTLQEAKSSAAETAAYLDTMRVGGDGARLTWHGDTAILTVTTMMGADTIEEINAAYAEMATHGARALIIDLRQNGGGAFAVQPLVGHVLRTPLDAGVFVSQAWAREMNRPPSRRDIRNVAPWTGWSLTAFWRDVQDNRVTRIRFTPLAPGFDGPVFVLVSRRTASAAEMAADALQASGRATLIGERTAGRMLSQKMYDLPHGFQLSLPIADYYAFHTGRIEGHGVVPRRLAAPSDAMAIALDLASSHRGD